MIDVWEVWPHWLPECDYFLGDADTPIEDVVARVVESWLDESPNTGEQLAITIKAKEMRRAAYEELTAPEP